MRPAISFEGGVAEWAGARVCAVISSACGNRVCCRLSCMEGFTAVMPLEAAQRKVRDPVRRPTIPERVDTLIFTMTSRTKAFTVFGLMARRVAISFVVKPWTRSSTVSRSRGVRSNRRQSSSKARSGGTFRSSSTAIAGWGENRPLQST